MTNENDLKSLKLNRGVITKKKTGQKRETKNIKRKL